MYRIIIVLGILAVLLTACSASEQNDVEVNEPVVQEQQQTTNQQQTTQTVAQQTSEPAQKTACIADSDCGERRIENAYCFQGQPSGDTYDWKCENAGTPQAKCVEVAKKGVTDECQDNEFCSKGKCTKYANCTDTDGGLNYTIKGKVTTNDLAVYEDKCDDNTLTEYYCSTDDRAFSEKRSCNDCSNGRCVVEE